MNKIYYQALRLKRNGITNPESLGFFDTQNEAVSFLSNYQLNNYNNVKQSDLIIAEIVW